LTDNAIAGTPTPNTDLLKISDRTGGRAFFNRNDLQTGIRRALDDSQFTYTLAYYPTHNRWKGEWRKIQVQVSRPRVTLLARPGYFAMPDATPVSPKNRFEFLSEIAASPVDSTELPLRVHLAASQAAEGSRMNAQVHLDVAPLLKPQTNGHSIGNFEVMFMQVGEKGKLLEATQRDVDADLTPEEYAEVAKNGWDLPAELKFMPGAEYLCVILHDKSSEAVGSVRIPLAGYGSPATH
jgi:hypothetical protein